MYKNKNSMPSSMSPNRLKPKSPRKRKSRKASPKKRTKRSKALAGGSLGDLSKKITDWTAGLQNGKELVYSLKDGGNPTEEEQAKYSKDNILKALESRDCEEFVGEDAPLETREQALADNFLLRAYYTWNVNQVLRQNFFHEKHNILHTNTVSAQDFTRPNCVLKSSRKLCEKSIYAAQKASEETKIRLDFALREIRSLKAQLETEKDALTSALTTECGQKLADIKKERKKLEKELINLQNNYDSLKEKLGNINDISKMMFFSN